MGNGPKQHFMHDNTIEYLCDIDPEEISKIRDQIPKGYFFGLSETNIEFYCSVIKLLDIGKTNKGVNYVIDLGSGKGYIDRILSNHYNIKTFCVDSINDRLIGSLRLSRLIKDDSISNYQANLNRDHNFNTSSNMKIYKCELKGIEDFIDVVEQALIFFNNGRNDQNVTNITNITIIGLKLCGDMYYDIIDWLENSHFHSSSSTSTSTGIDISLLVAPCCPEKSQRFPELPLGSNGTKPAITPTTLIADMSMYTIQKLGMAMDAPLQLSVLGKSVSPLQFAIKSEIKRAPDLFSRIIRRQQVASKISTN